MRNIVWSTVRSTIGIFRRRQRLADLILPVPPRAAAPEVIDPQEAALQQIRPQVRRFLGAEVRPARLAHHDERAAEERRIGEPHDDRIRIAFAVLRDAVSWSAPSDGWTGSRRRAGNPRTSRRRRRPTHCGTRRGRSGSRRHSREERRSDRMRVATRRAELRRQSKLARRLRPSRERR